MGASSDPTQLDAKEHGCDEFWEGKQTARRRC
jgi:hypothetical protein